jgi:hypothetical protein
VVLIITAAVLFRLFAYGELGLSVATLDTQSYIESAQSPVTSWLAFAGRRPFTMNLLFKLADEPDCGVTALSMPAIGKEAKRAIQECLAPIVIFQAFLSSAAWAFFIYAFCSLISLPFARILSAVVLAVVAFVPQIVDWDSLLTSESLTFSLFAAFLGVVLLLSRPIAVRQAAMAPAGWVLPLLVMAAVFGGLWIMVRDTNWYSVAILCVMAVPLVWRNSVLRRAVLATISILMLISALSALAASRSSRWQNGLRLAMEEYVLPHPARVEAFQRLGMPEPSSASYGEWFESRAPVAYLAFLGTHPGFVGTTLFGRLEPLFAENNQPYFKTQDLPLRDAALKVGDLFHPESWSILAIDIVLVAGALATAVLKHDWRARVLAFVLVWLFASAACMLVIAFFADPTAVERHVVFSLFLFRFAAWLGILSQLQIALDGQHSVSALQVTEN